MLLVLETPGPEPGPSLARSPLLPGSVVPPDGRLPSLLSTSSLGLGKEGHLAESPGSPACRHEG